MFACKAHLQMQTRGFGAGEELTPLSPEVGFRGLEASRLFLGGSDTPYPQVMPLRWSVWSLLSVCSDFTRMELHDLAQETATPDQ